MVGSFSPGFISCPSRSQQHGSEHCKILRLDLGVYQIRERQKLHASAKITAEVLVFSTAETFFLIVITLHVV